MNKFFAALDNLSNREYLVDQDMCAYYGKSASYAGIIKAITQGHPRPGSPMYVFTHASPKPLGRFTEDNAIYQATKNDIPVNVFLYKTKEPLTCLLGRYRSKFSTIGKATEGFLQNFKSSSSVKLVEWALGTSSIAIDFRKYKRAVNVRGKYFYIDDIAENGTIVVLNEGGRGNLYNPKGEQRKHERDFQYGRSWTILRPLSGTWELKEAKVVKLTVLKWKIFFHVKLSLENK